jgi:hypothetical protein
MLENQTIERTTSDNKDFQFLTQQLDHELWYELNEDRGTYDQYNKVPGLQTVVVVYVNDEPAATGCFKKYNRNTVEIKRMFVQKQFRGRGLSKLVLTALEDWAKELRFDYTILETSIHFAAANALYKNSGYEIIPNYDQYEGLEESVCMKKLIAPSEFSNLKDIEYFNFEEDFIEKNVRCIPMIVRFKMDAAGIKLKLAEWSRFKKEERVKLALMPTSTAKELQDYRQYLTKLVMQYTSTNPTELPVENNPDWNNRESISTAVVEKSKEFNASITLHQWQQLTSLQRFALLKLSKSGHENINFPKAFKEFNLT